MSKHTARRNLRPFSRVLHLVTVPVLSKTMVSAWRVNSRPAALAATAVPARLQPLLLQITCAGCGCLVDQGVIVTPCRRYAACCCHNLRVRTADKRG